MKQLQIDITHIPFSRYGAYVSVTQEEGKRELVIHYIQRRFGEGPSLSLAFGKDGSEDFVCWAEPEKIMIKTRQGKVVLYIRDDKTLILESNGVDVIWKMLCTNGYGTEEDENRFRMYSVDQRLYMNYLVEHGQGELCGPLENYFDKVRNRKQQLRVGCINGQLLMAMRFSRMEPEVVEGPINVQEELAFIHGEWENFLGKMPETSDDEVVMNFCRMTWYNLWSCFVRAEDVYHKDMMLMSKKFMSSVWSWDHCFNALAMIRLGKEKALEQFEAPFVLQSPKGALPDMWNPYTEVVWGVTKPPIHGWCFSKLMDSFNFTDNELIRVYGYLSKWTDWWRKENDSDHDGIPEYPQGCDSGWDNCTLFDSGFYIEAPDLSAYLILQMYAQARIAGELADRGKKGNWKELEQYWKQEAQDMMQRFIDHSWNGIRFVAKMSRSHEYDENPTSLISLMPLVLGEILDKDKRESLITILKRDFLTENGLATEMPASKKYESDGYWRGPIWAPTTYLIVDGLMRAGEEQLAIDIAERYCKMSVRRAKGNYENFDAITGKGLRAPGYTWSASVYMLFQWEYGARKNFKKVRGKNEKDFL